MKKNPVRIASGLAPLVKIGVSAARPGRFLRVAGRLFLMLALLLPGFSFVKVFSALGQGRKAAEQNDNAPGSGKKARKKRVKKVVSQPVTSPLPMILPAMAPAINSTPGVPATATKNPVLTPPPNPQQRETPAIRTMSIQSASVSIVNFRELAAQEKLKPASSANQAGRVIPPPMTVAESTRGSAKSTPSKTFDEVPQPNIASPSPASQFQGEIDQSGGGVFFIPPDTMGAVGLDKVFVTLNNNYKIQNKATGAQLSLVSMESFWASTGATGAFDPRIQYDPYNNRWILSAASNGFSANSSILLGLSNTSDPQGTYTLFRFIVGCAGGSVGCNAQGEFADFPMLGFNKNWVAIGWNTFSINTGLFVSGDMLVVDYPALLTGTANGTRFTNADDQSGICMYPATTFSNTEETLYIVAHQSSAGALYRLHSITGTAAAPVFNLDGVGRVRPGGGWAQPPSGDALPQQCIAGVVPGHTCPPSARKIEPSDSFIRSSPIFRNGKIWYAQAIALPAGAVTVNSRFAAQWTVLNPGGTVFDGGRVEDATATTINGGKHYSYPSLAVNMNNDVLLGFTEFENDDYADAGYAFRFGVDAAGTMRDPVIYKEGEDYYAKDFGRARNRWGDYSSSAVDPSNDRDLWTIQEYPMLRVGATGQGTNDSRWGTWWAKVLALAPTGSGELLISEFRLHGPAGVNDEFIEIYNNTDSPVNVVPTDGSAGYAVVADDGNIRFTIPAGTTIPARGHYLGCNSVSYSLASYPAGHSTTATCDATYNTNITSGEDTDPGPGVIPAALQGIALFNTANAANFTLANRLDAVGFVGTANALYKEGSGLPNPTFQMIQHSFYRSLCPGNTPVFGTALGCAPGSGGRPKDSDANENDFVFVDTNGNNVGLGQRLGAPGPENLSSPIDRNSGVLGFLLDATVGTSSPPNRVRDVTSDPPNNSNFGTLDIRRRVVNNTGAPVTRLRFRIIDITTFPGSSPFADLRARTSSLVVVSNVNDSVTCLAANGVATTPCTVNVQGTTLEQPPSQSNGGAFNSSMAAGTVTLGTPLAPGASLNVRFLLGVRQTGNFRFFINVEALP